MKFIIDKIQSGKTTKLLKIAVENNSYIIVPTKKRATQLYNHAIENGFSILFPITIQAIIENRYHPIGINSFVIDDIEEFIGAIIPHVPVIACTGTEDLK